MARATNKVAFLFKIAVVLGLAFGFPYYGPPLGRLLSEKVVGMMNDARAETESRSKVEPQKVEAPDASGRWDPATQNVPPGMTPAK
jgi:hypothetical protein